MKSREVRGLLFCLVAALTAASATSAADRCAAPVPANHCMIGTWQAESTNAPSVHNRAPGPSRWVGQDMGDNQFVFRADGTFSQETKRASTSRFEQRSEGETLEQTVKITSKSTGRWSPAGADGLVLCKETFEMKMGETSLPAEVAAAETTGEIAYRILCQGDSAEVTMQMPGGPEISWSARRVQP